MKLQPNMKAPRYIPMILATLAWGILPAQIPPAAPATGATATTPATPAAPPLPDNVTLAVKGELRGLDGPIDLSWNGTGPKFTIRATQDNPDVPQKKTQLTFRGTISLADGDYLVTYSLNYIVAIPVQFGADGTPSEVANRSYGLNNSVHAQPGQPVTLVTDQGKKIILTLTKTAPSAPSTPAPPPG